MVKIRRGGRDRDGEGGGKGKGKGGKGKAKGGKSGPSPLEEARKLQKKAERATGRGNFSEEAVRLYREAIEIYLSIYNSGTASRDDQYEVMIAMAECYTYTAEISADSVRGCDNITQENAIKENVVFLCKQAAEIYKKVQQDFEEHREDISVNLGTTLSVWAENVAYPECLVVFQQSCSEYDVGLSLSGMNSDTLLNKGDLLQRLAEVQAEAGQKEKAHAAYTEACKCYEVACTVTDSHRGDDLVGLLENWGACLLSFAYSLEGQERETCLQQAQQHLNGATSMDVTSTKGMNALGDIYVLRAENGSLPLEQRTALLEEALNLGYRKALAVDRNNLDAAVGLAEVKFQMGKLFKEAGHMAHMQGCMQESAQKYTSISSDPKLWKRFGSVGERSDFLYNTACALAGVGALQEACSALAQCFTYGLVSPQDVIADSDLANVVPLMQSS